MRIASVPGERRSIFAHNDPESLRARLEAVPEGIERVVVIFDGIFSMRGDHAPLAEIVETARRWDARFPENVVVVMDDSHGVGAFGQTGRGTEEVTGGRADVVVATLGKALGVNGGYVVSDAAVIDYLRETAPTYIYSNPITAGEAAAALAALDILDSPRGRELLDHLRRLTRKFERGLVDLGFEVIPGEHPVVPLMVRDTAATRELVAHLRAHGVLATGLAYPVVPRGDEEIRFQITADLTDRDIDHVLSVLAAHGS
jgi:glycine C-acetyltransferase